MSRIKAEVHEQALRLTRQKLLASAAVEFARAGYEAANINGISLSAGFAKGTVYNYFESKRELLQALVSETASLHHAYITA